MTPLKLIRKLGKLVRGGAGPGQIFLGCLLGVLIGMIPGINLTLVLAIALLGIFNANGSLAALGFALGKSLCLLLAPYTFLIGYVVIYGLGLEGAFRAAARTPGLALMDLHVYCLVGGLPVALVVGCLFGWLMVRVIAGLRAGIVSAAGRSERVGKLAKNKPVRLLLRLVFGKQKTALAEMAGQKELVIRKFWLFLSIAVVAVALGAELVALDWILKRGAEAGLRRAVGAEVNIARANLSLFSGELEIEGVQVTDPDKPTHNLVSIEKLHGGLSVRDLLTRRLVIDKIEVTGARTDTPRSSPGRVYKRPPEEKPQPAAEELPEDAVSRYVELNEHFRKYGEYLESLRECLKEKQVRRQQEQQEETRRQRVAGDARNRGYLSLSAMELLAKRPAWTVRELTVDEIAFEEDGELYRLELRELSSRPALHDKPMTISLAGEHGLSASASFDFTKPEGSHRVRLRTPGLRLTDMLGLTGEAPVSVARCRAKVDLNGVFNAESMRMPVVLNVTGLQATVREGRTVFGLEPATAKDVFENLPRLTVTATIEGPIDAPSLKLDEDRILENLKDSLVKAGQLELLNRAEKELLAIRGALAEKLPGELDKLLPGSKKDEKEEKAEDEKDPVKRMLEEKAGDLLKLPSF